MDRPAHLYQILGKLGLEKGKKAGPFDDTAVAIDRFVREQYDALISLAEIAKQLTRIMLPILRGRLA